MLGSHASGKQFSEESVHSNPQVSKNFEYPRADQWWRMDTN